MFEPFTDGARRVIVLAQEQARQLRHDAVGTEHILLGMLIEHDGVAGQALQRLDVRLEDALALLAQGQTSRELRQFARDLGPPAAP